MVWNRCRARPEDSIRGQRRCGRCGWAASVDARAASADGTIHLRSPQPLERYPRQADQAARALGQDRARPRIPRAARRARPMAQAYLCQALADVRASARHCCERELSAERPIAILSGNDIEHALLGSGGDVCRHSLRADLGGLFADVERLRQAARDHQTADARVWCSPTTAGRSRARIDGDGAGRASSWWSRAIRSATARPRLFAELLGARDDAGVDAAHAQGRPDTIAKFLFTSGSTGNPKGVINTQRMLCSNQAMIASGFAFVDRRAAGGGRLAAVEPHLRQQPQLQHGARPTAARSISTRAIRRRRASPKTARNLREIAPTIYFNVPKGFEALMPHFRADEALRRNFFSRLKVLFYAGAGLKQITWDELTQLAVETTGERIIFLSSLGSTETAPLALACTWDFDRPGQYRPAGARRRTQARAERGQARSAAARPEHHARLLAAGRISRARPSTRKASTRSATR